EHQTTIQQHAGLISEKASLTVVDTINDKVSTVEASVETIAGQVSLKANAEEVYTKSEVNTELGKKVDTTVYNSQMTQLDVKVDGVTADIRSVQSEVSDVDTRLISAQTQLNMQAGLIDAKAERSELTTVDGKVTGVRNDLTTLQFSHNGLNSTVSSLRNDFDGLEIGGRNMLRNSSANNVIPRLVANVTTALSGITRTFVEDYTVLTINRSTSSDNFFQIGSTAQSDEQGFVNGQTYAISFDAYIPSSNAALPIIFTFNYETSYAQKRFTISGIEFNKWKRYKVIIDFNQSNGLGKFFRIRLPSTQIGDFICIKNIKLEKGNKSTDWSPAPEDIDSAIYTIEEFASRIDQKADSIAT
ncbi:hypothetical protein, partial [Alkalihalophilus marmarensis]|uniref:hypothetical protein n=1 Tax=Alkalihalophilus marmarensis TaxID=521377 RepID=UPI002E233D41|nr:hypothetical protein [Alkalihalophilus marmarensis]